MSEEILPNLFKIEVPLPQNPLKAVNSYVIKAHNHSLIIDTGMNREECMEVMASSLKKLDVDLDNANFFITHMHADHSGLVSDMARKTSTIYGGQADAAVINSINSSYWEKIAHFARMNGFPEDELQRAMKNHPGIKYSPKGPVDFSILREGDTISIGDYLFKCIETPGHTKGHLCLYEPNQKILISGDHVLVDITPNISLWSTEGNPLKEYLLSLDNVYNLDIGLLLPGHRSVSQDCRTRIQELKHHHQTRASEVLSILEEGSHNAYQVASQMSWDMRYQFWDQFPSAQKWFATGEACAHLKYLEEEGKIRREIQEQKVVFSLAQSIS